MMTEQTISIQVEDSENPVDKEEGEQMQDRDISQQIEKMVEAKDMDI